MEQDPAARDTIVEDAHNAAMDEAAPNATVNEVADPSPGGGRKRFYPLDALRGLAIGLMIVVNWAGNWSLPPTFGHSEWHGLTLADVVFPGFMLAMGTAIPFASRQGWRRVVGRTILLILIGSALSSYKYQVPFDLSPGVLQMLGIAYLLTWLITRLPKWVHPPLMVLLILSISAAYLWVSVPGVRAGSFDSDANLGMWLDAELGLEPHPENLHAWLPAVGSVYLGYLAGAICISTSGGRRIGWLSILGGASLVSGALLSLVLPVNKYLWTPSFVLVTGGLTVLALVVLTLVIPSKSKGGPMRPLVLLGGHAIVIYAISETLIGRAREDWYWPEWEPILTERYGEVAAGYAYPLGAVLACVLLAWLMERLNIRVRL